MGVNSIATNTSHTVTSTSAAPRMAAHFTHAKFEVGRGCGRLSSCEPQRRQNSAPRGLG